jgi:hypothetical protein
VRTTGPRGRVVLAALLLVVLVVPLVLSVVSILR